MAYDGIVEWWRNVHMPGKGKKGWKKRYGPTRNTESNGRFYSCHSCEHASVVMPYEALCMAPSCMLAYEPLKHLIAVVNGLLRYHPYSHPTIMSLLHRHSYKVFTVFVRMPNSWQ